MWWLIPLASHCGDSLIQGMSVSRRRTTAIVRLCIEEAVHGAEKGDVDVLEGSPRPAFASFPYSPREIAKQAKKLSK